MQTPDAASCPRCKPPTFVAGKPRRRRWWSRWTFQSAIALREAIVNDHEADRG